MTVVLKKTSHGLAVIIPKQVAASLGLRSGMAMSMRRAPETILLRRRRRRSLREIVRQISPGSYSRQSAMFQESPVGKEVW